MKRSLVLIALLSLLLFAGCGSSNSASSTTQSQPVSGTISTTSEGYLYSQDTQIIYIQWTESNGQFTGSWNAAMLQNSKITYANLPITGTHDSSSGSVNFIINLNGKDTPISGTLQNSTLALQMQQNGQNTNWTFHSASNLDYQTGLTSFQQKYPG
jgi:ABC-type glycerol-3-phosphate transport system substrate-binding protein